MNSEKYLPFVTEILSILENSDFGKLICTAMLEDDSEEVVIDIEPLAIPQYPIYDVHSSERVSIVFTEDDIPTVFCRTDFQVVPHLTVHDDGRKSLCLFDVPFYDVKYMLNASMLLHRIRNWFEKTARNELHQLDQPLEPFFPYSGNMIILNPNSQIENAVHSYREWHSPYGRMLIEQNDNTGTVYVQLLAKSKRAYNQNIINQMPKTLGELDNAFESRLLRQIEEYLHYVVPHIKRSNVLYERFFKQSDSKLRCSKVLIVVYISLARNDEVKEGASVKCFVLDEDLQTIYKRFGYKYPRKGTKVEKVKNTEEYKNIPLTPYEVHFQLSKDLAQKYNGEHNQINKKTYVQIGVGALGSQIANNCIRSGFGKWVYVDDDILLPHNLSRHCLKFADIGRNKAEAMKEYAQGIICTSAKESCQAINGNILRDVETDSIQEIIKSASLVVDTSASVALGRSLSYQYAGKTRSCSIFMNPVGDSLVVLLEDADRSVSLDSLEMQYYKMLLNTPELEDHLASADSVVYSSGCRNSCTTLSQDNVAIFSGIASKTIKSSQSDTRSHIHVWKIKELNIEHFHNDGETFISSNIDEWTVKIFDTLIQKLHIQREIRLPNETGGLLLGSFDYERRICYIVDSIPPPKDSLEYPKAFIRGSQGVKESIKHIETITAGNLTYIGEWHSHPTTSTEQSTDDKKLLESISSYTRVAQCSPGCMVIVGEERESIFLL